MPTIETPTTPETTQATTPVVEKPAELSDPNLSFTDYARIRRGETVVVKVSEGKAAPDAEKHLEQKKSTESAADGKEEKEKEGSESSDESEDDAEDDEKSAAKTDDAELDKPKKKGGFQRRIDKLNAAKAAAQAEAEFWRQQALKYQSDPGVAKKEAQAVESAKTTDVAEGEPDPGKFETHAEYVKALTRWEIQRDKATDKAEKDKSKFIDEQKALAQAHMDRVKAFSKQVDDYKDVTAEINDIVFPGYTLNEIAKSELGPQIGYELAKNRAEAERIAGLPMAAAIKAIGKIEERLESKASEAKKPETETKKITQTPKPIQTVGAGKGSVAKSIDDPNLSFADYERLRREQLKRKGA